MKKITKIKLINWHVFYNDTIDVVGNILLTGENGSGKSTIMDAVHFLLSGGMAKFNPAASSEASRTLETYMRGKLGYENRKFLRNDPNIISHIAVEYFDDVDNMPLVLGVVFEIRENSGKPAMNFYRVNGKHLEDSWFMDNDGKSSSVINYQRFVRKFIEQYGKPEVSGFKELSGSRKDVRRQIADMLHISYELDKYYELLPKAMAFRPIVEVKDFVFRFLLPQKDVDLETMRQSMQAYRELQQRITLDQTKLEKLNEITTMGQTFRDGTLEQRILVAYEKKIIMDDIYTKINKARDQVHALRPQADDLAMKHKNAADDVNSAQNDLNLFLHSDRFQAMKAIQEKIDRTQNDIVFKEREVLMLNRDINEQAKRAKELAVITHIAKYVTEHNYKGFLAEAVSLHKDFEETDNRLRDQKTKLEADTRLMQDALAEKRKLEEQLRSGVLNYDRNVVTLQRLIKESIRESTGADIPVIPFCELLDIKPGCEEWRDAVEGYLNTRRMDLFVPDAYYDEALRIYERSKKEYNLFGVGLVNCAKIKDYEPLENSLATKVETDDDRARRYANYILGEVVCVDSEDDLKNYECAITRTVMVYRNKAARQTRSKVYEIPYIGRKAIEIQHDNIVIEIDDTVKQYNENKALIEKLDSKLRLCREAITVSNRLVNAPDSWGELEQAQQRLIQLQKEKADADNGGALTLELDGYRARIRSLEVARDKLQQQLVEARANLLNAEKLADELALQLDEAKKVFNALMGDSGFQAAFDAYVSEHKLNKEDVKGKLGDFRNSMAKVVAKLEHLMEVYIQEFAFDSQSRIENLDDFFKERNFVVERDLQQFMSKAEEVKEQAMLGYRENYIAVIRRNVKEAIDSISKLNKILDTMPFGPDEEIYHFEYGRTSDPRFAPYYDVFDSNQEFDPRELFSTQLSDANLALMVELFERLTHEPTSEQEEKLLREFTDYRKFMEYDIRITNKRGETAFFSAINKEKSGGELQTPFYVIIAASFDQIAQNGFGRRSPGCLVMLDEVFDKMDGDRIGAMMKYFSKLTTIQLIMAAPTDRGRIIMPYVDTTVGIVKSNNRARAVSVIKDE